MSRQPPAGYPSLNSDVYSRGNTQIPTELRSQPYRRTTGRIAVASVKPPSQQQKMSRQQVPSNYHDRANTPSSSIEQDQRAEVSMSIYNYYDYDAHDYNPQLQDVPQNLRLQKSMSDMGDRYRPRYLSDGPPEHHYRQSPHKPASENILQLRPSTASEQQRSMERFYFAHTSSAASNMRLQHTNAPRDQYSGDISLGSSIDDDYEYCGIADPVKRTSQPVRNLRYPGYEESDSDVQAVSNQLSRMQVQRPVGTANTSGPPNFHRSYSAEHMKPGPLVRNPHHSSSQFRSTSTITNSMSDIPDHIDPAMINKHVPGTQDQKVRRKQPRPGVPTQQAIRSEREQKLEAEYDDDDGASIDEAICVDSMLFPSDGKQVSRLMRSDTISKPAVQFNQYNNYPPPPDHHDESLLATIPPSGM